MFMNESPRKNSGDKTAKKDRYTAVLISQIAGLIIVLLAFNLFIKKDEGAYARLKNYIGNELFSVRDIAETVKDYFSRNNVWVVSGDNVIVSDADTDNSADEAQTELFQGAGGEDLTLYEAARNTSFAPIKSTSPAISPVEEGRYTSFFGYRINPVTGEFSFHTGLDIAAVQGTKIRAVYNGRVLKTGEDSRAGKYVLLSHQDGYVTFYCHCSEILVQAGALIRQGETIAKVGSTGQSTGPHVHFEVRKNNIRYNPLYILEK